MIIIKKKNENWLKLNLKCYHNEIFSNQKQKEKNNSLHNILSAFKKKQKKIWKNEQNYQKPTIKCLKK